MIRNIINVYWEGVVLIPGLVLRNCQVYPDCFCNISANVNVVTVYKPTSAKLVLLWGTIGRQVS